MPRTCVQDLRQLVRENGEGQLSSSEMSEAALFNRSCHPTCFFMFYVGPLIVRLRFTSDIIILLFKLLTYRLHCVN